MVDLTSIALTGVTSHKTALATVGHNIANVDTEGYSRQVATFSAYQPKLEGTAYVGQGAFISNVSRITNQFLTDQLYRDTQNKEALSAYNEFAIRIDSLLGDDATALTPSLINFFNAVNDVNDDAASIPARQVLLSEGDAIANRFGSVFDQVNLQNESLNQDLATVTSQITQLAQGIAGLNESLQATSSRDFTGAANDLLDKRDEAIRQLSELVGVTTIEDPSGMINVSIGSGQPLVVGNQSFTLKSDTTLTGLNRSEIVLDTRNAQIVVTEQMYGGRLGGLLDVRKELIDPVFNEIGRLAIVLSDTFNTQHRLGMDLNNLLGGDFFTDINSAGAEIARVAGNSSNTGNIALTITVDDTQALTTDNYEMIYDSASGNYSVFETTNGSLVGTFAAPATFPSTVSLNDLGFSINFDVADPTLATTHSDGDKFTITPTRLGASYMGVEISTPNQIAAASPVRADLPTNNAGTGFIQDIVVTDTTTPDFTTANLTLSPPYRIEFSSTTDYDIYDVSVAGAPVLVGSGVYTPNQANSMLTNSTVTTVSGTPLDPGYDVVMDGAPQTGDQILISYNQGAAGDNRNGLRLAELQRTKTMAENSANYQEAYNRIVGGVGTRTRDARIGEEAAVTILRQTQAQRESVSGVNLDEEAASLIRFQNAFQASAKVIQVSKELFDIITRSLG